MRPRSISKERSNKPSAQPDTPLYLLQLQEQSVAKQARNKPSARSDTPSRQPQLQKHARSDTPSRQPQLQKHARPATPSRQPQLQEQSVVKHQPAVALSSNEKKGKVNGTKKPLSHEELLSLITSETLLSQIIPEELLSQIQNLEENDRKRMMEQIQKAFGLDKFGTAGNTNSPEESSNLDNRGENPLIPPPPLDPPPPPYFFLKKDKALIEKIKHIALNNVDDDERKKITNEIASKLTRNCITGDSIAPALKLLFEEAGLDPKSEEAQK
ncbi:MAG: hypothetical protein LBH08_01435, partial [Puniceicoccales bacterium]|nr:hypothetical protein [Puniceicoccales bacterium]